MDPLLIVYIVIAVLLVILACTLLFVIPYFKKKKKNPKIDEDFINHLVSCLGEKDNIISAQFTNGRVNFELEDIEKAKLDDLKALSTAGVFITNSTIKMLFSYDSEAICKAVSNKN